MSKELSIVIKGIFTIIILMSHFNSYINLENNSIYVKFISLFG